MNRTRREPNPVYARLTAHARPPSLPLTVGIGLAVSVALAGWLIRSLPGSMYPDEEIDFLINLVMTVALAAVAVTMVVAVTAAILTAQDTSGEAFTLLRATQLTGRRVVRGYVAAALYRARVLLVAAGALLPMSAAASYEITTLLAKEGLTSIQPFWPGLLLNNPTTHALVDGALPTVLFWLGTAGWVVLGAGFGVWMALWWRRGLPALLSQLALPVLFVGLSIASFQLALLPGIVIALAEVIPPWLLLAIVLRLAARGYGRAALSD